MGRKRIQLLEKMLQRILEKIWRIRGLRWTRR